MPQPTQPSIFPEKKPASTQESAQRVIAERNKEELKEKLLQHINEREQERQKK